MFIITKNPYICNMAVKLANIVTDYSDWQGYEYNVVSDISKIDKTLPTLIVGYMKMKELHPDVNILEHKYSDNLFWTYTKLEDRNGYVEGLSIFKSYIKKAFLSKLKYTYLDPYELTLTQVKEFISYIKKGDVLVFKPSETMVYLYKGDRVFGIDLSFLEFIGINKERILSKISNLKNMTLLNSKVIIEYKDYSNLFEDNFKFIPLLYNLDDKKEYITSVIHT